MGSTFNPTQTYSGTGSTTAPTSTVPGTTASTATTGSTTQPSSLTATQISQFESAYDIDSTDLPAYVNGNQLTSLGQALEWYGSLDEGDRQTAQEAMASLGYLTAANANGESTSTDISAFKSILSQGKLSDFQTALSNPLTASQLQVNSDLTAAQKEASAPITATLENPTTLAATITSAFDQALGFSPSEAEVNSFISQIQGQDTTNAEAPRAEAQAEVSQAQSQQSALNQLGDDGIDSFLTAYQAAVHGSTVPGAGTTQGPATGSVSTSGNYLKPGSKLPSDTVVGFTPSGAETVANVPGTLKTTTEQVPPGSVAQLEHAGSSLLHLINPLSGWSNTAAKSDITGLTGAGTPYTSRQVTTTTPGKGMATAPNLPAGTPGSTPTYGGVYALSTSEWQAAQKALGTSTTLGKQAAKASTAGAASVAVQQAAATALASSLYEQYNSWSDVAIAMAGGTPGKTTTGQTASGTKTNIQTFAESLADQVNSQIKAVQNTINNTPITTKVTTPDAAAEAAQAAKQADPTGYYAANAASWGSMLSKMVYGTPLTEMESTSDTFTGPVGSDTALTGGTQASEAAAPAAAPTNTPTPAAA